MLWINTTTKYQCLIRQGFGKILCGYVGVGTRHKLYGMSLEQLWEMPISVHGGLTFSGEWADLNNFWYIGFDCGHFMDAIPEWPVPAKLAGSIEQALKRLEPGRTYKDLNFVAREVESLAHQLKELE